MHDQKRKRFENDRSGLLKLAGAAAAGDRLAAIAAVAGDRRSGDRVPLIASAEVIELVSGARFTTRTTDLGPGGCFMDTLTPIPVGAQVRLTVQHGDCRFETKGSVVYSQTGLGMGVAFDALDSAQRATLDTLLGHLTDGPTGGAQGKIAALETQHDEQRASDRDAIGRLVQILVSKKILTDVESRWIFHKPVI